MIAYLLAGMFIGSIIASIAWGFVIKTIKTKAEFERKTREELMHTLGELWLEIDSLLTSFHSGMMDERSFRDTFSAKIDAINHTLKPNLHMFDVYYVKYIENLIKDYTRMSHLNERPVKNSSTIGFSSDMETNYSPVPSPEQTDLFKSQIEEQQQPETVLLNSHNKTESAEPAAASETIFSTSALSKNNPCGTEKNASQHKVSNEVDTMFDNAFSIFETTEAASNKDTDNAQSTTIKPQSETKQDSVSITTPEIKSYTSPQHNDITKNRPLFEMKSSLPSKPGEEDFSTETLIDVDLSTIAMHLKSNMQPASQEDINKTSHSNLQPQSAAVENTDKTELEVVISTNATHAKISDSTIKAETPALTTITDQNKDVIPEETTFTRADDLNKKAQESFFSVLENADEDFEVIIPEKKETFTAPSPSDTQPIQNAEVPQPAISKPLSTEEDDDIITGDDIADKIASLEALSVSQPEKKTAPLQKQNEAEAAKKSGASAVPKPSVKENLTEQKKDKDESISGDDVAEKIDAFFGLFKE